jgi:hypothetical protein
MKDENRDDERKIKRCDSSQKSQIYFRILRVEPKVEGNIDDADGRKGNLLK